MAEYDNTTCAKYYSVWHKRYIENFQQTEVSDLKIIKTIKPTIVNTQKHPVIATTQPLGFSCETKACAAVIKLF